FGLAKLLAERPAAAALTAPQVMLGTMGYMAPEQITGADVDTRSDMFAFGTLLYEMAVGRPPFVSGPAILHDVLNRPVTPPRQMRTTLSRDLEALVLACLEKDPARRPTARAAAAELRRITARTAASDPGMFRRIESIAVLPLENLSRDEAQEYFADG